VEGVFSEGERKRGEQSMVKSTLKDVPKVAADVEVAVADTEQTTDYTLWGADAKNVVLMGHRDGFPSPRSIPWGKVERIEITLFEQES
jgi:hypothetical protein